MTSVWEFCKVLDVLIILLLVALGHKYVDQQVRLLR